jgi:cytidyltransferase-like protein
MTEAVFIGTFDPFHGAHIGQLLRAHKYKLFDRVYILVNKNPAHKPNATDWRHRVAMSEMTLEEYDPPFDYQVIPVENALSLEINKPEAFKVTGVDSLLEVLSDERRWPIAFRWPMVALSIPGAFSEADLKNAVTALPSEVGSKVRYEYVSEDMQPIMNYDFDKHEVIKRRIHSTYVRNGKENSLVPETVRDYIKKNNLYQS